MARNEAREQQTIGDVLQHLALVGDPSPHIGEKLALAHAVSAQSELAASHLLEGLVRELHSAHNGLHEAVRMQSKLKGLVDRVTAPVWHPAVFLSLATTER